MERAAMAEAVLGEAPPRAVPGDNVYFEPGMSKASKVK